MIFRIFIITFIFWGIVTIIITMQFLFSLFILFMNKYYSRILFNLFFIIFRRGRIEI